MCLVFLELFIRGYDDKAYDSEDGFSMVLSMLGEKTKGVLDARPLRLAKD